MSIFVPPPIEVVSSGGSNETGSSVIVTDPVINQTTIANTTVNFTTENFETTDNLIEINKGETGSGVGRTVAGIAIDRGSQPKYHFVFNEISGILEAGFENAPTRDAVVKLPGFGSFPDGAIPAWSSTEFKLSNSNYIPSTAVSNIKTIDQKLATTSNVQFADIKTTGTFTANGNTMTFPSNAGSAGRVLSTDGSGNLSWIVVSGGGGGGSTSSILDSDGNTAIETERTPNDNTIRFKANNVDVITATQNNVLVNTSLNYKKTIVTSTDYTILDNDLFIYYNGTNNSTLHLPDVSNNNGRLISIYNNTNYVVTVDNIHFQTMLGSESDILLYSGESIKLLSDGVNGWI
jgi:hypothetical protein